MWRHYGRCCFAVKGCRSHPALRAQQAQPRLCGKSPLITRSKKLGHDAKNVKVDADSNDHIGAEANAQPFCGTPPIQRHRQILTGSEENTDQLIPFSSVVSVWFEATFSCCQCVSKAADEPVGLAEIAPQMLIEPPMIAPHMQSDTIEASTKLRNRFDMEPSS